MALKIFIFIFLFLSFVSIESNKGYSKQNSAVAELQMVQIFESEILKISCLQDLAYSSMNYFVRQEPIQPSENEIVINEIMADPTPVAGLPDREYIELFNTQTTSVSIKGWILDLGGKQKVFPDITVGPGNYLIITAPGGAKDLQSFGNVLEISGFMINNSGLTIALYDNQKRLADRLDYDPSLHKKGFEDGGYSLERIDPERKCGQKYNWATTMSAKGGSPGSENTVRASNPDQLPPQIIKTTFVNNCRLDVQLSESFVFPVLPYGILKNITAGVVVDSIKPDQKACLVSIYFRPQTIKNGENYSLILHGIADECGNLMKDQEIKFGYYLPVKEDLLINEVLFNPFPEGTDFVEIYNNSGHEVDLSRLFLATRDEAKVLAQICQLSVNQKYLAAGSYLAVTKSREGILQFYRTKCEVCLLQMERFPSLSDQSGCVVLLDQQLEVIDEMTYTDGMHHPLITEKEGISLERISFDLQASRKENWHSASSSTGFATPGYKNSVVNVADSTNKMIAIDQIIFSPNGDGINDRLIIYINTGQPGWLLNITILNCVGREIRRLANNLTTGTSDELFWDGLDGDFQKVQPGIYVLKISLFERSGKQKSMKLACVVTDRL